jgi:hypothetical protein
VNRRYVLIGSAAVVAVGVALGLFFALKGGGAQAPQRASSSPSSSARAPRFQFRLASVRVVITGRRGGTRAAGRRAAERIRTTLDTLYSAAFLDPSAWRTGRYGLAWGLFAGSIAKSAHDHRDVLTLGSRAGATFDSVAAHPSRLDVRVLMDRSGNPSTAVGEVSFTARGEQKNGGATTIVSEGQYFLRPGSHGWVIDAFDVKRRDRTVHPKPAPPTPSASSSGASG